MNYWKFWPKRSGKGSYNRNLLPLDLLSHLSYMSAIATAGVSRSVVFEQASNLPYVTSSYFRRVHILGSRLNYDYAEACRLVGESGEDQTIKSLLLRLSGSLGAGEPEKDFLNREAEVQAEAYGDEYERKLESSRKWTDSYAALTVSAGLIIIVAVISMMMSQLGMMFILGLAGVTVLITVSGAWIVSAASPKEPKVHSLSETSSEQRLARTLFKILVPLSVVGGGGVYAMGYGLGWAVLLGAALIFPVGYISARDDKKIGKRDEEIAPFLRALGGIAKATGTTVSDAVSRIDIRSVGALAPEVRRLNIRLLAGIDPNLCWRTFVGETGSELVDRTVRVFWDGTNMGGDPQEVGSRASFFAMKISLLRAKRRLVAATFGWLSIPMHIAITALLLFVINVLALFGSAIDRVRPGGSPNTSELPALDTLGSFAGGDMEILSHLVILVVLVLTVTSTFAVKASGGGHAYLLLYHGGIMMAITGANLIIIPKVAISIFDISAST